MYPGIIQAQYHILEDIANRFFRQSENISEIRLRIEHNVRALHDGGWIGEGSASFLIEMDENILPALTRLTLALEQSQSVTLKIKDTLRTSEEEAASLFDNGLADNGFISKKGKLDERTRISRYDKTDRKLFVNGKGDRQRVHPNDISQGALGDCFFVTSLAVVASQNPDLIQNAIRENGDGTYTVIFYEKRGGFLGIGGSYQPVEITVTPAFPVREVYDKETGKWSVDSSAPHAGPGDNELWPGIIEKAYAQWKGDGDATRGYQILNDGGQPQHVLEALAGTDSESTTKLTKYSMEELAQMHENGAAITLSSFNITEGGGEGYYDAGNGQLHTTHAYWIESIDVKNNKIVVRNPWGYETSPTHRIELSYDEFTSNFYRIDINPL